MFDFAMPGPSALKSLWFDQALLDDGWARQVRIRIADGRIKAIEAGAAPEAGDERHGIALPGIGNLHSHAFQRAMAGLTEARVTGHDSFWSWRALMYRFLEKIGPEDLEAIAALAFMEMLEGGFTRVGEFHYLHHAQDGRAYADPAEMSGRVFAAAETAGIGLTLLPVFYAHSGFGGLAPTDGQKRFIHDIDGFEHLLTAARDAAKDFDDAVVGLAPHSLRAVTQDELMALAAIAGKAPIHIHIAEQVREVEDCLAFTGQRPVAWLLDHAGVGSNWCLVHATHIDDAEIRDLARSGAVAGLCPTTEANLGDGIFPAAEFVAAGGIYGIGSDSNVSIDAAEELRLLEYSQRLSMRSRNVLAAAPRASTGASLYHGALRGGSRALRASSGIRVGEAADIVSLDPGHASLFGKTGDDLLDAGIFGARCAIDCVWRYGRKQVSGGRHVRREAIKHRYQATLSKLIS
jgi:formiminoglutamate deiminase